MDPIEKAARAMCKVVEDAHPTGLSKTWIDECWPAYEPQARAAFEALREPTNAMIKMGEFNLMGCEGDQCEDRALHTWKTMIDEILKGKSNG